MYRPEPMIALAIVATSSCRVMFPPQGSGRIGVGAGDGRGRLHRADELEVVVVRVGERGDPRLGCLPWLVGLLDDLSSGSLEPFEVAFHVGGLDVPDHPPRVGVPALHLVVWDNADRAPADLPSAEASFFPGGLAEKPGVVLRQ